jgi:hypothetical protein
MLRNKHDLICEVVILARYRMASRQGWTTMLTRGPERIFLSDRVTTQPSKEKITLLNKTQAASVYPNWLKYTSNIIKKLSWDDILKSHWNSQGIKTYNSPNPKWDQFDFIVHSFRYNALKSKLVFRYMQSSYFLQNLKYICIFSPLKYASILIRVSGTPEITFPSKSQLLLIYL